MEIVLDILEKVAPYLVTIGIGLFLKPYIAQICVILESAADGLDLLAEVLEDGKISSEEYEELKAEFSKIKKAVKKK